MTVRALRKRLLGIAGTTTVAAVVVAGASGLPDGAAALAGSKLLQTAAGPVCSKAAALEVATPLNLVGDPTLPRPISKVLCGSFTGPGSRAMVAVFARGTCLPSSGWAVFRSVGGSWRLVLARNGFSMLAAAGTGIRETVPVWRAGDPQCFPSGGTRTRSWRWDGKRLTAGAWTQAAPPKAAPATVHLYYFLSPSHNILCGLGDEGAADCRSWNPPQSAYMRYDGTIKICKGSRCVGPPLSRADVTRTPVLEYGQRNVYGGYSCRSETTGITCVKLSPGKGRGKGFLINREGIKRIGP